MRKSLSPTIPKRSASIDCHQQVISLIETTISGFGSPVGTRPNLVIEFFALQAGTLESRKAWYHYMAAPFTEHMGTA
jgi:hypothetical protein